MNNEEKSSLLSAKKDSSPDESDQSQTNSSSFQWSDCLPPKNGGLGRWLHLRLFPVELCSFLFLFVVYFQMQVYQQYYFQRVMKQSISDYYSNMSDELNISLALDDVCLNQDQIVNLTNNETFVNGQKKVNIISMITTLVSLVPSIVTSLLVAPLSDRFGRKPILVLVFIGQTIGAAIGVLIVELKLSMYVFLVSAFSTGICGGFGVIMATVFAYITDVTPKRWLTIRMGILEASIFVGTATSSAASDKWIEKMNCDFRPMVWFILVIVALGFLYSIVIPESLTKEVKIKNKGKSGHKIKSMIRGAKILCCPSYIGFSKLWKFWVAIFIMILAMINETGLTEISSYFLHNKPLEWTYSTIGNYLAVSSVSHMLALLGLLPILVLLKIPDAIIILIGVLFACGMCIFIALLTKSWEMFLGKTILQNVDIVFKIMFFFGLITAGVIIGVEAMIAPGLRSIMARMINKDDLGKLKYL